MMQNFTFKVGVAVRIDGRTFTIAHLAPEGWAQLASTIDGSLVLTSVVDLQKEYQSGRLQFHDQAERPVDHEIPRLGRPLSTFPSVVRDKAIRKKKYLELLSSHGPFVTSPRFLNPLIRECAQLMNDPNPPSSITVYRWQRRLFRAGGDPRALIDRFERRGKRSGLPLVSLNLLSQSIESIYLAPERRSVMDVYFDLRYRVDKANEFKTDAEKILMPSLSTVYRAIRSLDVFDVTLARQGKRIANIDFRTSGAGARVDRILERVEIDHTPLDLFVLDEHTQLPLGRPTVTIALDKFSRMPIGMHVGFQGPSVHAVLRCLRHAIVPKADLKERYPDIEHDWPCHGKIRELVCDNGLEFHSKELERVAFDLGMIVTFCPKRQPWYKGAVERYLKTVNFEFAASLPGKSFSRWFHREDYDPQEQALVTHEELIRVLTKWIVDIYAHSLHRGINSTPHHQWIQGAMLSPPVLPSNVAEIDITIGETVARTLSHQGIELDNLRYNGVELLAIRKKHGPRVKVDVISYFDDVSKIAVVDPDSKTPIDILALDQEYACGLTREQHRLLCAHTREANDGLVDQSGLARAKAEIRTIIAEYALSKSQRKRQKSAKWRGIGTDVPDVLKRTPEPVCSNSNKQAEQRVSPPIAKLPKLSGTCLGAALEGEVQHGR